MLDESLRRRLEALNRGPLPQAKPAAHRAATSKRKAAARSRLTPAKSSQAGAVKPLPGLLRTGEVITTTSGEHLRITVPLEQLWPQGTRLVTSRHEQLAATAGENQHPELTALMRAFPQGVVLLDLETCGLAGSALFLVGLLRAIDGVPTVELLLARNYAEERCVLESLWQILPACEVLVTFNGKSFDWPMVSDRRHRHLLVRGAARPEWLHVDLLHHCRRRWRRELADCRLQTLEQHVCRRSRMGDIPGHMIPAAYADYVRTGFEREMESILYHNAVDLVTLLDLALRVAG